MLNREFDCIRCKLPSVNATSNHLTQDINQNRVATLFLLRLAISSKVTAALHWWPERCVKMDADSLACALEILGLVDPEQKKGNLKLFFKYILRQFNSEDAKGSNDGYVGTQKYKITLSESINKENVK